MLDLLSKRVALLIPLLALIPLIIKAGETDAGMTVLALIGVAGLYGCGLIYLYRFLFGGGIRLRATSSRPPLKKGYRVVGVGAGINCIATGTLTAVLGGSLQANRTLQLAGLLFIGALSFLTIAHLTVEHRRTRKSCPDCAEQVLAKAKVCKHCGWRWDARPQPVAIMPDIHGVKRLRERAPRTFSQLFLDRSAQGRQSGAASTRSSSRASVR